MGVKMNAKTINDIGELLITKDKELIRKFLFLFNPKERSDFLSLLVYYNFKYSSRDITQDQIINALINVKINEKFNHVLPNNIFLPENIKKIRKENEIFILALNR